jgi:hypothetical protein
MRGGGIILLLSQDVGLGCGRSESMCWRRGCVERMVDVLVNYGDGAA